MRSRRISPKSRKSRPPRDGIRATLKLRLPLDLPIPDLPDVEYAAEAFKVVEPAVVKSPRAMLARAAISHSMPVEAHAALTESKPVTVLLETPTPEWTDGVARYATSVYPGVSIVSAKKAPARGAVMECPRPLAPIIAVASNPSWLSATLIAGADYVVRIALSNECLEAVIAAYCGTDSCRLTVTDYAGLDLCDLAFAMRPRSSAEEVVTRLQRAVLARAAPVPLDRAPDLSEMAQSSAGARRLQVVAASFIAQRGSGQPIALPNILLFGPPGTGKTTLAKSFARAVGAPFTSTSVAEWFCSTTGHLGDVASAAQRFFDQATILAPSVALLDEIDAIPNREAMDERDRSWWSPIITGLLMQIDTLRKQSRGVVLIAATNHKSKLDPALVRPGRFDLHLEILGPTTDAEVESLFRRCLGHELQDQELGLVLRLVGKPTAAMVESWVERARQAAQSRQRQLLLTDLLQVIAPPDARPKREIEEVALHEAAHAVVASNLGLVVHSVSIVDSADAGGVTQLGSASGIFSRDDLERKAIAILAGRASDERFARGATSGAASDLWKATSIVADVHLRLGLGNTLLSRQDADATTLISDPELRLVVEADLHRLMNAAREQVEQLERPIRKVAGLLIERRVLSSEDIGAALRNDSDGASPPTLET